MSEKIDLAAVRREYLVSGLDKDNLLTNPFDQFSAWMEEAIEKYPSEATSMTLATADADGYPAARIVLLKDYGEAGFTWFTNYKSEKGRQLTDNNRAELLFYWAPLERQVRVRGRVEKLSHEESQAYFSSRPVGSQIGAIASSQSEPIEDRSLLETRVKALEEEFSDKSIPCPAHWGGYRLMPQRFEFWQGRASRLHDRYRFTRQDDQWLIDRLQP